MIIRTAGYQSSDKQFHATLEDAKRHEIGLMLDDAFPDREISRERMVNFVFDRAEKIMDILTTTSSSKVRGRKVNGGTKKRAPKHIAEQTKMFTEPPTQGAA